LGIASRVHVSQNVTRELRWSNSMSDINLTLSTRANLLSLQTTKSLLDRTSNRLSTGLKVNAPIDNAPAFFAAQALNFRASNFDTALSNINQAVKSVDNAINGLRSIQQLVQNAQGLMTSLKTASSATASDTILQQIDILAGDANYQGVNLINNSSQTLQLSFANEPGVIDLSITAVRSDSVGLFLSTVAQGLFFQLQTTIPSQSSRDSVASIASVASTQSRASIAASPSLQSQDSIASNASVASAASLPSIASNATNGNSAPSQTSVPSFASIQSRASRSSFAALEQSVSAPSIVSTASVASVGSAASQPSAAGATVAGANLNLISATELSIGQALSTLSANQATLGSTNAILAVRLQFTQSYVSTLQGGASLLTVADLNLESANLTSLQTAQSLGVVSLQISTQSQQSILRLF
jgi:flagellin-like hook-associated protein FlgL